MRFGYPLPFIILTLSSLVFSAQSLAKTGAHPDFARVYHHAEQQLNDGELEQAGKSFGDMAHYRQQHGFPPYEEAHFQLLKYKLAKRAGNEPEMASAQLAVVAQGAGYIAGEVYASMAMDLLKQQLSHHAYAEAQQTYARMKQDEASAKQAEQVSAIMAKVDNLVQGQSPVVATVSVNNSGKWQRQLIRPSFYLDKVSGDITTLELDCVNKKMSLNFDADSVLTIPKNFGACKLTVNARQSSQFELVQLHQ